MPLLRANTGMSGTFGEWYEGVLPDAFKEIVCPSNPQPGSACAVYRQRQNDYPLPPMPAPPVVPPGGYEGAVTAPDAVDIVIAETAARQRSQVQEFFDRLAGALDARDAERAGDRNWTLAGLGVTGILAWGAAIYLGWKVVGFVGQRAVWFMEGYTGQTAGGGATGGALTLVKRQSRRRRAA